MSVRSVFVQYIKKKSYEILEEKAHNWDATTVLGKLAAARKKLAKWGNTVLIHSIVFFLKYFYSQSVYIEINLYVGEKHEKSYKGDDCYNWNGSWDQI